MSSKDDKDARIKELENQIALLEKDLEIERLKNEILRLEEKSEHKVLPWEIADNGGGRRKYPPWPEVWV